MTTDLPASLDDAHLIPWLVILDYGDEDVMTNTDWLRILAPAYAEKAAAVRALLAAKVREGALIARREAAPGCDNDEYAANRAVARVMEAK